MSRRSSQISLPDHQPTLPSRQFRHTAIKHFRFPNPAGDMMIGVPAAYHAMGSPDAAISGMNPPAHGNGMIRNCFG
jgi:hypothetical protein